MMAGGCRRVRRRAESQWFQGLRHSYISRAIEGEVPLNIIGDNCGTSIRMIETTYAKVLAGKRREFIERGAPSLERVIAIEPASVIFTRWAGNLPARRRTRD